MNNKIFILSVIYLFLIHACCRSTDDECLCEEPEVCINDRCELPENVEYIGSSWVRGFDLYKGVNNNCSCIDTLLFDIGPEPTDFTIITEITDMVQLPVLEKRSEHNYFLGAGGPFCGQINGKFWYSYLDVFITEDSIDSQIYFYELGNPGVYIDSCKMTFYK